MGEKKLNLPIGRSKESVYGNAQACNYARPRLPLLFALVPIDQRGNMHSKFRRRAATERRR